MNRFTADTTEIFDARLKFLDALIAKSQAIIDAQSSFRLEPRAMSFGFPLASCESWERLGTLVYEQGAVLPADSRWATPTYVTGDVDPSVAFAVAVGLGES